MIIGKIKNICCFNVFGFCYLSFVSEHLIHLTESELVSANQRLCFFLNLINSTVSN